jgi:hypothetical protein
VDTIRYRITYAEGETEIITVRARSINSGFTKALRLAREPLGNGITRELARVEFWHRPFAFDRGGYPEREDG